MLWGYVRSTRPGRACDRQRDALTAHGIEPAAILVEHSPAFELDAFLEHVAHLRPDDVVVVESLDKLGRDTDGIVATMDELGRRGIGVRTIREGIDATGTRADQVFVLMAALAQRSASKRAEAARRKARTRAGRPGRPASVSEEQAAIIRQMGAAGISHTRIAESVPVSRATIGRLLRGEISSLAATGDQSDDSDELPLYV